MDEDALLAAESGERRVAADLRDVQDGAGGEGLAPHRGRRSGRGGRRDRRRTCRTPAGARCGTGRGPPLSPPSSAATITCPCGGRIDSRPCVEITRACTPRSATAPARLCRTRSGRSSPLPSHSVKRRTFRRSGRSSGWSRSSRRAGPTRSGSGGGSRSVRHAPRHDGRYPELGDHERGRPAPPDGRVHDGLLAAEVSPRLVRRSRRRASRPASWPPRPRAGRPPRCPRNRASSGGPGSTPAHGPGLWPATSRKSIFTNASEGTMVFDPGPV